MTFDEWWNSRVWHPRGCEDLARAAWNAAIQEYATEVLTPILQLAQKYLADVANLEKGNEEA